MLAPTAWSARARHAPSAHLRLPTNQRGRWNARRRTERTRVVLRRASAAGGDSIKCWPSTGLAGPNSAFPDGCGYRALKQRLNCPRRASAGVKVARCLLSSPPKNAPPARRIQNRLIRIHFSIQFSMQLMVVKPLLLNRGSESAIGSKLALQGGVEL